MNDILALYCKGTTSLFKCKTANPKKPRDHRRNKAETPNGPHPKPDRDAANDKRNTESAQNPHRPQQQKRTSDQTDQQRTPKSKRKAMARTPKG